VRVKLWTQNNRSRSLAWTETVGNLVSAWKPVEDAARRLVCGNQHVEIDRF
jgi:hypothetical protein